MQTAVDYRLGGTARYFVGRGDIAMRLPDEVQKCVVFLGRREAIKDGTRKFVPYGTAFLVSLPSAETSGFDMTFLVTAKHVAEKLEPDFDIRFNTKDARADYTEVLGRRWFYHPTDKSVDAAVMLWGPPLSMDCLWIPHTMFVNADKMAQKGIGVGDEVYATGLFMPVIGKTKNTPIVRTGHLAMSPPEMVPVNKWITPTMEAYLIEMRSLGGLSGSPVFVQRSIEVKATEPSGRKPLAAGAIFLLGLMHGHWNVKHLDLDYVSPQKNDKKEDLLNAGIAIIPPAEKITEILMQETLMELFYDAEHAALRDYPVTLDGESLSSIAIGSTEPLRAAVSAAATMLPSGGWESAKDDLAPVAETAPPTKAENPQHKEDFNSLLDAAVTGPQSKDQT